MPDVVGMELSAAQQKLSDAGLVISVEYALSETVEEDHVISQSIAANTPIYRGDQVTIVIATKEPLVIVPNVVGHPQSDAESTLKALEFDVNVIQSFDASVPAGYVINQDPKADSSQKKGVRVTIIVSKGPEPTPTPDPNANATQDPNSSLAPGVTPAPGTTPGANVTPIPGVTPGPANGQTYWLTFNANGGTVSEKERQLSANSTYGQLPNATRDYYSFDGWYTAANGGTKVSSTTVITGNTTLYAHWTERPVSDWILASDVPDGVEIVDTKWTYTEKETKESSESEMDGWTFVKKEITGYGEEKKSKEDPSDSGKEVYNIHMEWEKTTEYMYYHFHFSDDSFSPAGGGEWHEIRVRGEEFKPIGTDPDSGATVYRRNSSAFFVNKYFECDDWDHWYLYGSWPTEEYRVWYYQEPIYTYYFTRDTEKESTTDPSSQSGVSNVKKYVKYRSK